MPSIPSRCTAIAGQPQPRPEPVASAGAPARLCLTTHEAEQIARANPPPDATCLKAGDAYVMRAKSDIDNARRCYAGAGFGDGTSDFRIDEMLGRPHRPASRYAAAEILAEHCAIMAAPIDDALDAQAYLAALDIDWPDENAFVGIVEHAYAGEMS